MEPWVEIERGTKMKVAYNDNYYSHAKSNYTRTNLHSAPAPCQVKEQEQKAVQPGKGKVQFSIPKEESTARDGNSVLSFGGNKRNKVSEKWNRKLATRREVKVDSKSKSATSRTDINENRTRMMQTPGFNH